MAKIRVLRLLEYVYNDVETMDTDMRHWVIQGRYRPNSKLTITSVSLPITILDDIPEMPIPNDPTD